MAVYCIFFGLTPFTVVSTTEFQNGHVHGRVSAQNFADFAQNFQIFTLKLENSSRCCDILVKVTFQFW